MYFGFHGWIGNKCSPIFYKQQHEWKLMEKRERRNCLWKGKRWGKLRHWNRLLMGKSCLNRKLSGVKLEIKFGTVCLRLCFMDSYYGNSIWRSLHKNPLWMKNTFLIYFKLFIFLFIYFIFILINLIIPYK